MHTNTLKEIEACTNTQQQYLGFAVYRKSVEDGFRSPSYEDFQTFYSYYCAEKGLFNDINDSDFPVTERLNGFA